MTETELRELDAWIYKHVPGLRVCECVGGLRPKFGPREYAKIRSFNPVWTRNWPEKEPDLKCDHHPCYSANPADAMDVLKACCEKMAVNVNIWKSNGNWFVNALTGPDYGEAETLELAICLFARKLFA